MRSKGILVIMVLAGCQYLQPKEVENSSIVARVGTKELIEENIKELMPTNLSPEDSTIFVEKFITDWVKKQLMIQRAEEAIDFNEAQIQSKVLDYQYALMVHELERKFINEHLNEVVSQAEVEAYYKEKSENFILRQHLVKCIYFKIPKDAPNLWRFKKALKKYPSDTAALRKYTNEYAVKVFTEDSVWVKFDEILLETPLKELTDKTSFLRSQKSLEVSDNEFIYFLNIFDHRTIGEVAPLEFIRESVEDVIINKRKIQLKKELEKKIYEEAEKTKAFEIYSN